MKEHLASEAKRYAEKRPLLDPSGATAAPIGLDPKKEEAAAPRKVEVAALMPGRRGTVSWKRFTTTEGKKLDKLLETLNAKEVVEVRLSYDP